MEYYGYMEDNKNYFFLLEFINGLDFFDFIRLVDRS